VAYSVRVVFPEKNFTPTPFLNVPWAIVTKWDFTRKFYWDSFPKTREQRGSKGKSCEQTSSRKFMSGLEVQAKGFLVCGLPLLYSLFVSLQEHNFYKDMSKLCIFVATWKVIPRRSFLLEELIVAQLSKDFSPFLRIRRVITMFIHLNSLLLTSSYSELHPWCNIREVDRCSGKNSISDGRKY
jgi:hypothetical protein